MSVSGKALFKMYNKPGGKTILAHRLNKLLFPIKGPADIALHNEIWCEVLLIIEGQERRFLKGLVDCILFRAKRRKMFLLRMADLILELGQRKKG
jgi:hypothetical protein